MDGMDPEAPASRFTMRPAVMVVNAVSGGSAPSNEAMEAGIRRVIGDGVFEEDEDIGAPSIVNGSIGRGAEGFAAVLEWMGTAAGAGVIGGGSWAAFNALVRGAKRLMSQIRNKGDNLVYVSRGFGVLLAADAVLSKHPSAKLSVEVADEPSALAGYKTPELNYVAIEPWLVTFVDFDVGKRYVVIVRPTGDLAGMMEVPLEQLEDMYLPLARLD